jgi:hypothetical protein
MPEWFCYGIALYFTIRLILDIIGRVLNNKYEKMRSDITMRAIGVRPNGVKNNIN